MDNFKAPILFLIFNRLNTTKQVFSVIQKVKPQKLYIASDGPRNGRGGEKEIVDSVRKYVLDNINWECEIKTLFREKNLGCKVAVSSAIDWFFENEEEGIILEDDCLPDLSFFQFCQELLEKYRNDERVAIISGNNFNDKKIGEADYYFKRIPHIWGWATWKRVWDKYDVNMSQYAEFKKNNKIKEIWSNKKVQKYWNYIFSEVLNGSIDTWDYQLTFCCFNNNLLNICPNKNLVRNIGFGDGSTNTTFMVRGVSDLNSFTLSFPLNHPVDILYSEINDNYINKKKLKNYYLKLFLKKIGIFKIIKKNI